VIDNPKYNRLYKKMERIRAELREMPGDQRRALLPLLSHSNVQVRLAAARSLLALYPDLARNALESIREFGIEPQKRRGCDGYQKAR
jgi:RNA:NAD 2'-phosphotransferase (TPT1/KptA family)